MNTAQLLAEITAKITTGGRQTSAVKVRGVLTEFLSSFPNVIDGGLVFQAEVGYNSDQAITNDFSFVHKKWVLDNSGGSQTLAEVLAEGNETDGGNIIISIGDYIASGNPNKSEINFGASGDEFNYTNDGGGFGDAFIVAKSSQIALYNLFGQFSADSASSYVFHNTKINFTSPKYYFDSITPSKIAVFNSLKELVSGTIDESDILTVDDAGLIYIPLTGTNATHLTGIIEFDNTGSESALSTTGTMVIGGGDDKDYNNANRFAYLQVSGNSTVQAMLKTIHTGLQNWIDLTNNGTINGIKIGSNYASFAGLVYDQDFSPYFGSRSIPDVGFVQSVAALYIPLAGSNAITGDLNITSGKGIDSIATGGTDVLNIGATSANVINYGNSSTLHNFLGTAIYELQVNSYVTDKLMTLNYGGSAASGIGVGYEIEENSIITGYQKTNAARSGWSFKAPANADYTDFVFSASIPRTKTFQDTTSTIAEYANKLSVFSATTSAELASVISDETGYSLGALLVFSQSPTIDAPNITGVASVPTASPGTNTTQPASTAFVQSSVSNVNNLFNYYNNF